MGCVRCLCMRCGVWGMADYCEKGEAAERGELLQACQETAIALGTSIEESYGEGTEAVRQLEEYCELVYRAAEEWGTETALILKAEISEKSMMTVSSSTVWKAI